MCELFVIWFGRIKEDCRGLQENKSYEFSILQSFRKLSVKKNGVVNELLQAN